MSAEKLAAQARLDELRLQLIEIEKAKKQEASVRKEIESLAAEIANRASEAQFYKKENDDDQEDTDAPAKSPAVKPGKSPAMSATKSPAIKAAEAPEDATKKRIKALNKKLQQITALKEKSRDDLDSEQKKEARFGRKDPEGDRCTQEGRSLRGRLRRRREVCRFASRSGRAREAGEGAQEEARPNR